MTSPLPVDWQVPEAIRSRIGEHAGRQRAMSEAGHVLIILHGLPDPNEPDLREARLFWRSCEGEWRSSEEHSQRTDEHARTSGEHGRPSGEHSRSQEAEGQSTASLDEAAGLQHHLQCYAEKLSSLEDRVERARTSQDYFSVLHEVLPLRRATRNMHLALQEARNAIEGARELIALRDRSYDLERAAELVHGFARDGLDFIVARESEQQAQASRRAERAAHRLNQLAALTLPITAAGSILGVNLMHGFESTAAPWLFWGVAALCLGLGFAVRTAIERDR
ncbi:MAG: hypothetical protein EXR75_02430 [Myxococcales bacterium]|nr:hypothetical protein [Myxococcales bacterium]